jgi:hypothetical protein
MQIVNGLLGNGRRVGLMSNLNWLRDTFLNEAHDFFCSETEYSENRHRLLRDCRAGETSVVAAITAAISPRVGGGAEFIVAGVAVTLTIIGKMTINAWCALQKERRGNQAD